MEEVKKINETKPATFRFMDDDIQKFKELASDHHLSQSEMFGGLLNTFEINKAKQSIPDRAKEIETFQVTAETLKSMFLNSLEINQTSEQRIREELSVELKTKDQTIADLQESKDDAKIKTKNLLDQVKSNNEKIETFEKAIKDAENKLDEKVTEATDRQMQIKTLTDQLNYQSDDLTRFKTENVDLIAKKKSLEAVAAADQLANQKLKTEIEKLKNELKSEVEKLKNELMLETKQKDFYSAEVNNLKNDYKIQYQKLEDNIEKKDEEIKALKTDQKLEISSLKDEIKAEKDEAVRNAIQLKKAEFDLIKQKIDYELKQAREENKKIKTKQQKDNNENKQLKVEIKS